jgi:RHS repeat-associated protein
MNEPTISTTPAPPGQTGYETTTKTYDLGGRLISVTSPPTSNTVGAPNDVITYTYDNANKLLSTTTGSGTSTASTSSTCYDPDGNVTATVPGDGNVSGIVACSTSSPYGTSSAYETTYSRDSLGEVVIQTAPATAAAPSGEITTYTYDPAGNVTTMVSPDGITTSKTYTPLNLVATVTYSSSTPGITYTYDADGNVVGMTDASGTTTNGFDSFDEQTNSTNGAGLTVSHAYNLDGVVDRITYPLASGPTWTTHTVAYQFDQAEDLTVVTDFNGSNSHIVYNADGLPTTLHLGTGGAVVATTYGANDEPSTITVGSTLQEFSYSDTPSGVIASETDTPSSPLSPANYVYDAQSRVIKDTPGSGSSKSYAEDASGNLTTLPSGTSGTYNDASEMTSGGTTTFTYDKSGNRVSESGGATVSAGYNAENELTSYSDAAANMTSVTYNGIGLRTSATTGSSSQNFLWDTVKSTPELLQDSTNAYIYGPFGTPFEEVNLSTGTAQFLVDDALGSVRSVVSASGSLTASTSYDAWGNPETSGGLSAYTPFGFAGGYTDSTNLVYLINRYYDPTVGSFVTVDPDVTMTNQPYLYVADDPMNATDRTGLRLQGPGTASCGEEAGVISCTGATSNGTSVVGSDNTNTGALTGAFTTGTPAVSTTPTSTSPYNNGPSVVVQGPTYTIPLGPITVDATTSLTIVGPNSNPNVQVDPEGDLTLSGAGGSSATFAWYNPSVDLVAAGSTFTTSQTASFGDGDRATVTFTLTPQPPDFDAGGWEGTVIAIAAVTLVVATAGLGAPAAGEIIISGGGAVATARG